MCTLRDLQGSCVLNPRGSRRSEANLAEKMIRTAIDHTLACDVDPTLHPTHTRTSCISCKLYTPSTHTVHTLHTPSTHPLHTHVALHTLYTDNPPHPAAPLAPGGARCRVHGKHLGLLPPEDVHPIVRHQRRRRHKLTRVNRQPRNAAALMSLEKG